MGFGLGEHPQIWDPTYFCSHWSYELQIWYTTWVWGVAWQETTFTTKIGGDPARGASKKLRPPTYFCSYGS